MLRKLLVLLHFEHQSDNSVFNYITANSYIAFHFSPLFFHWLQQEAFPFTCWQYRLLALYPSCSFWASSSLFWRWYNKCYWHTIIQPRSVSRVKRQSTNPHTSTGAPSHWCLASHTIGINLLAHGKAVRKKHDQYLYLRANLRFYVLQCCMQLLRKRMWPPSLLWQPGPLLSQGTMGCPCAHFSPHGPETEALWQLAEVSVLMSFWLLLGDWEG